MEITITQEHIANGKQGVGRSCPISLALNEKGYANCITGTSSLTLDYPYVDDYFTKDDLTDIVNDAVRSRVEYKPTEDYFYNLKLKEWVKDFDEGEEVKPFVLKLDPDKKKAIHKGDLNEKV